MGGVLTRTQDLAVWTKQRCDVWVVFSACFGQKIDGRSALVQVNGAMAPWPLVHGVHICMQVHETSLAQHTQHDSNAAAKGQVVMEGAGGG